MGSLFSFLLLEDNNELVTYRGETREHFTYLRNR